MTTGPRPFRRADREPVSANPRRVRGGVKMAAPIEELETVWPAMEMLSLIDHLVPADRREEGLGYATGGQTLRWSLTEGRAEAAVQGRRRAPYTVSMEFRAFTTNEWERIVHAMAEQAVFAATLPSGELPPAMRDLVERLGLSLTPRDPRDVVVRCECESRGPCKHAATLAYLIAEQLKKRPTDLFLLRGLSAASVIERLTRQRAASTRGFASAHLDPFIPGARRPSPPLEAELETFWSGGPLPDEGGSAEQHAPHALLRRLGPSPLEGRFPIVGLLASVYDEVSVAAQSLRDEAPTTSTITPPLDEEVDS